ncbi:MAG: hypothetical protein Q9M19_04870 [Mariprofundaceae bacterium]|nr:hypothetical protein [Mariprofundaceae bacterium]
MPDDALNDLEFDKAVEGLSDEELRQLEERILFPQIDGGRQVTVGGKTITLRPLPMGPAKRLANVLTPMVKRIDAKQLSPNETATQDDFAEIARQGAVFLLNYYAKLDGDDTQYDAEWVDEHATLDECLSLCGGQVVVNGEHDFLLLPLRGSVIALRRMMSLVQGRVSRSLLSLRASAGTSLLSSLQSDTPSDKSS